MHPAQWLLHQCLGSLIRHPAFVREAFQREPWAHVLQLAGVGCTPQPVDTIAAAHAAEGGSFQNEAAEGNPNPPSPAGPDKSNGGLCGG